MARQDPRSRWLHHLHAEYNHGYPAVLKNALDYVYFGLGRKAVAFVSWGSTGGTRGVEQLRLVAWSRHAPTRFAIHIPNPWTIQDTSGIDRTRTTKAAKASRSPHLVGGRAESGPCGDLDARGHMGRRPLLLGSQRQAHRHRRQLRASRNLCWSEAPDEDFPVLLGRRRSRRSGRRGRCRLPTRRSSRAIGPRRRRWRRAPTRSTHRIRLG